MQLFKSKKNNNHLKRNDVDWSQSRVMFIAPIFTTYQKESINFKDLPIELWEINKYENNMVSLTQINSSGATESKKQLNKTRKIL